MISYLYFIEGEDFYGHKYYLKLLLRGFNIGFWFNSPLNSLFDVEFNEFVKIPQLDNQIPSIYVSFLGYTSNFILNVFPLLLIYLFVFIIDKLVLKRLEIYPNLKNRL
jgi:hypothetical protein